MLDLRKAFDTVQHDILMTKLEQCEHGITGITNTYSKSYVNNQ